MRHIIVLRSTTKPRLQLLSYYLNTILVIFAQYYYSAILTYIPARTEPHISTEFNEEASAILVALEAHSPNRTDLLATSARNAYLGIIDLTTRHALGVASGTPGERWYARNYEPFVRVTTSHKNALSAIVLDALAVKTPVNDLTKPGETIDDALSPLAVSLATRWRKTLATTELSDKSLRAVALGLASVYAAVHDIDPTTTLAPHHNLAVIRAADTYAMDALSAALTPAPVK